METHDITSPEKMPYRRKLFLILLLALGGGTIFKAMYLREVFYYPWNQFFEVTNTQSGFLMSWLGLVGIVSGAVAGVLVDRIRSPRNLLAASYFAMALLALWQSFRPAYGMLFISIGLMSFVGNGIFLVSMTKIVRLIADDKEQGSFFGILESGRGVSGSVLTFIAVTIVSLNDADALSIGFILRFDAAVYFLLGLVMLKLFPSGVGVIEDAVPKKLSDLLSMLKCTRLWIAAVAMATIMLVYNGASYLVPYLTDVYGMSADNAAWIGMIRTYCLAFVAAPIVGFWADKIGSILKVMAMLFLPGAAILGVIAFSSPAVISLPVLIFLVLLLGAIVFGLRGITYGQVNEIRIPRACTGTAMGILLFVGFSPEAFIHIVFGHLMDRMGNDAYPVMFLIMGASLLLGAALVVLLHTGMRKLWWKVEEEAAQVR